MDKSKRRVLKAGSVVGPVDVIEVIGHGGMGSVYRARHRALGKDVALKVLSERYSQDETYRRAFLEEAKIAARLEDAHIVQTYDVGQEGELSYIVMQLAKGQSLRDRLKRGRLPVEDALGIIEKIARGLQVAHEAGIVHRDIKPHNIVLTDDDVGLKILDFGLARLEDSLSEKENMGEIVGSMAFMAPEQIDYEPTDARTDIYALGVTAYQCLAGVLPFRAQDDGGHYELIARQLFERPAAPTLTNRDVPITVSRVILKMLEKLPEHRYQNMQDVLDELRLLRRHSLPAASFSSPDHVLNPAILEGGDALARLTKDAIRIQREVFRSGREVKPLCTRVSEFALVWLEPAIELRAKDIVCVTLPDGIKRVSLAEAGTKKCSYRYHARFALAFDELGDELRIVVEEDRPLASLDAHYLFDLLESLPVLPGRIELALAKDYLVQAQDVRWIVDVFNVVGMRAAMLTLVVASTQNYDTLVRLGLEEHIRIRLELAQGLDFEETTEVNLEAELDDEENLTEDLEQTSRATREAANRLKSFVSSGDYRMAVTTWKEVLRENGRANGAALRPIKHGLFESIQRAADEAYAMADLDSAENLYNLLVDLDAGRFEGHFGKGLVLKKHNKLASSLEFLSQAVIAAPDNAEIFYHRAIVRSRLGDDQGALRDLTMAIEHNPRHANSYFNRSKLNKKLGRADQASHDLAIAQKLNPKYEQSPKLKVRSRAD